MIGSTCGTAVLWPSISAVQVAEGKQGPYQQHAIQTDVYDCQEKESAM